MRIERSGRTSRASGADRAAAAGRGFAVADPEQSAPSAPARAAAAVAGLNALMALQGVDDPLSAKRRAVRRGHSLLGLLEDVKLGLLAGRLSPAKLEQLAAVAGEACGDVDDPRLEAVLAEIELRARVELAKFGRASA